MAYRVYPSENNAPLALGPGATSEFIPFDELVRAEEPRKMFLRLVNLGGCQETPPRPAVRLRVHAMADGGAQPAEVELSTDDNHQVPVPNRAGPEVPPIAYASYEGKTQGVYLIKVEFTKYEPSRWAIKIGNDDRTDRRYTWVVADNEEDTAQPWINMPATLRVEAGLWQGETYPATGSMTIHNYGTGDLILSEYDFSGEPFQLSQLEGPIPPNMCGNLAITYGGTVTDIEIDGYLQLNSNDGRADGSPEHNDYIEMTGVTRQLERDPNGPPPDDPRSPCHECGRCQDFTPPLHNPNSSICTCGHNMNRHG